MGHALDTVNRYYNAVTHGGSGLEDLIAKDISFVGPMESPSTDRSPAPPAWSAPMAYDEGLASRVRAVLAERPEVEEKRMFGGLTFMVGGHMCCGVVDRNLVVRVGPIAHAEAVTRPHARPMDFTGKPMRGMVYVGATGTTGETDLKSWVDLGLGFVSSLPPKKKRTRKPY